MSDQNPSLGPAHRLSRLMTPDLNPTTGAKSEPLRRIWPIVITGTLMLALFNAQGLEKWAMRMPASPVTPAIITGAQEWMTLMERLGPARVFDTVRTAFREFRGQ